MSPIQRPPPTPSSPQVVQHPPPVNLPPSTTSTQPQAPPVMSLPVMKDREDMDTK
jgi:hypothetical protein